MRALRHLLVAAVVLAPAGVIAEPEHEVKAAFLFKFLSYVEWPERSFQGPATPFVIGTLDADEVRVALEEIVRGRFAQNRPVEVRALHEREVPDGMHMVFVGRSASRELPRLAKQAGVLVVSEIEDGLDRGAMVNLLRMGDRIRFQVAPAAAEHSGLRISSRMLAVAQLVKQGPP